MNYFLFIYGRSFPVSDFYLQNNQTAPKTIGIVILPCAV